MNTAASLITKYILVFLMVCYTVGSFTILTVEDPEKQKWTFVRQIILVLLFHAFGFAVILLHEQSIEMVALYLTELLFLILYTVIFRKIYRNSSRVILSHMLMFLAIGFIILARLSFDKALKQFLFVLVASVISLIVPRMFWHVKAAGKWAVVLGSGGLVLLLAVLLLSSRTYGANLSLSLGPFTFQPSEFVKISFVLLIAFLFREKQNFGTVILSGIIAMLHVLILVWSTDLGGALIYAFAYLFMLYVATNKPGWLFAGLLAFSGAAVAAYYLFAHVRTRVVIWRDPWAMFNGKGSQVCNSLLGMATGGLLGTGLYEGSPKLIPIVEKDFIFAAITEEMGGIIGVCLILISLSCLIKFIMVASKLSRPFYRLTAIGLAVIYGVQVLLTVGGNIKFIPATGVTLPFVSYGGSSIFSTFILFSIMQILFLKARNVEVLEERFAAWKNQ